MMSLNFPGGRIRVLEISTDTPGDDTVTFTPEARKRWEFRLARLTIDTNGTVANRYPYFQLLDGSDILASSYMLGPSTADTIFTYTFTHHYNAQDNALGVYTFDNFTGPLVGWILDGDNQSITLDISGGVAGDTINGFLTVREFGL